MKKILILAVSAIALICASCMNECTCVTTYQFVSPGQTITNVDTTTEETKLECSLMNTDTTYEMHSYDTLGNITGTGQVIQQTICE
ncbi:MAG: hypothetical protein K6A41_09300 [Bacteroidales bacterium]|nr:hypothetical protein [Bacteroidales bacterium]